MSHLPYHCRCRFENETFTLRFRFGTVLGCDERVEDGDHEQGEQRPHRHARHQYGPDAVARRRSRPGGEHQRQVSEDGGRQVMSTGRNRVSDASRNAASFATPCDWSVLAICTIRMPFFAIRPTSVITPTWE